MIESGAIRTVIVDDEPAARRAIHRCCEQAGDVEVVAEVGDVPAAVAAIRQLRPELAFLDIKLAAGDAFQIVVNVPPPELPLIVFVTAYDRFAVRAFELRALDYLLKPFEFERFRDCLDRVRAQRARRSSRAELARAAARELTEEPLLASGQELRVIAEPDRRIVVLRSDEVSAVAADGNYLVLYRGREHLRTRCTLQSAESLLKRVGFLRIHRSVLVNLRYVRELRRRGRGDYEFVLLDGTTWTSSAAYRDDVSEFANRGLLGGSASTLSLS